MLDRITETHRRGAASSATRSRPMREPGHRCAHNLNYWQFGDYLGIGAGAHGKLSFRAPRRAPGALARAGGLHGRRAGRRGDRAETTRSRAPSCRSSSCSMRCACATASSWRASPSAPGCRSRRSPGRWRRPSGAAWSSATCIASGRPQRGFDFLNDLLELFLPAPSPRNRQRFDSLLLTAGRGVALLD